MSKFTGQEEIHADNPLYNQQGYTYLLAMFFVVLIGLSLMAIGQQWSVITKRDREAELLFRGNRIKVAIERFAADYEVKKGTRPNRFPLKLKELTQGPDRYLPVFYQDPMTGTDFELILVGKEIRGVRSTSQEVPFDKVNFKDAVSFQDVRFEASGAATNCTPNPLNPLAPTNCQPSQPSSKQQKSDAPAPSESPTPEG